MSPVLYLYALLGFGLGCVAEEPAIDEPHAEDELLVQFAEDYTEEERRDIVAELGFEELAHMPRLGVSHLSINGEGVAVAMRRLKHDQRLLFAEPNYEAQAIGVPNDPYFSDQWNMRRIGAVDAWDVTRGAGVVVAILDTGVDTDGSDGLHRVLEGRDFVYGRSVNDVYGHGTHVAGTVAQRTDNGRGAAGVAHKATILPVKVLGDSGSGWVSDIARGVEWAADEGADVINMSLGSWSRSGTMEAAVQYAHRNGVVLVAAAGNDGVGQLNYPAGYDEVIAVGASAPGDRLASFSNHGTGLDVVAPGVDIVQEVESGGHYYLSGWNGTSMASPHVAGIAALLKSIGVQDPEVIREIIQTSAQDLGNGGWDRIYGHGLIDAAEAVRQGREFMGEDPDEEERPDEPEEPEEPEEPDAPADRPDITAPQIMDVTWGSSCSQFWIDWKTNERSTSDVYFQDYGWYEHDRPTRDHHREFHSSGGWRFQFWVSSQDRAGNEAQAGPFEITLGC